MSKRWTKIIERKDMIEKINHFLLKIEPNKILNFSEIFANNNEEIFLEIGSGKGEYISQVSKKNPQINFLGLEVQKKRIVSICKKLEIAEHNNVKLANIFVDENISDCIPVNSISKIIIQHPDPWPKRRKNKNRLINKNFIQTILKILKKDGYLDISTDNKDYAEHIQKTLKEFSEFQSLYEEGFSYKAKDEQVETYFAKVNAQRGFSPIFMLYKKIV